MGGLFKLFLWHLLSYGLYAYDLSTPRRPLGPLGVTLDYSLGTTWPTALSNTGPQVPRNWAWSSHLTFNQPVSQITDAQLWQIAFDAYNEMAPDLAQYQINPRNTPSAMAVLAWGNQLILASSQKGPTSFSYNYPSTPVLSSLQLCQTVWRDDGVMNSDKTHRTDGKCSEQMAAHLYFFSETTDLPLQSARVAAVTKPSRNADLRATDPCGDPQRVS